MDTQPLIKTWFSVCSLIAQSVKHLPAMQETLVQFLDWEDPTPVFLGFPYGSAGNESTCTAGDMGSIPGLGRSPGERKGYPLQYSGLENSMGWIVHGVAKSRTQLSDFHVTSLCVCVCVHRSAFWDFNLEDNDLTLLSTMDLGSMEVLLLLSLQLMPRNFLCSAIFFTKIFSHKLNVQNNLKIEISNL